MEVVKRTPRLRKEAAQKLIEGGMSQRQAAKVLGVSQSTIRDDVSTNYSKSAEKVLTKTGSPETKERRAPPPARAGARGNVLSNGTDEKSQEGLSARAGGNVHTSISRSMDRTFTHHKTGKPAKMDTTGLKANGDGCPRITAPLTGAGTSERTYTTKHGTKAKLDLRTASGACFKAHRPEG